MKNISLNIFKGLKSIVQKALFPNDTIFQNLGETESFAYAFGGH